MSGSFDPLLVLLSLVIAIVASYTALELARHVAKSEGREALSWLAAGATSMGIGIWTMHFVGMLAFKLAIPFSHDIGLTFVSLLIAIAAAAFAIFVGTQSNLNSAKLALAGIVLGGGITGMHYTGMAAMTVQATIQYNSFLVGLSLLIAVVAATAAVWTTFKTAQEVDIGDIKFKVGAAVVLGTGICAMHYTGMLAASFQPLEGPLFESGKPLDHSIMAMGLGVSALFILGVTHLTLFFEYRVQAEKRVGEKAEKEAVELGKILDESLNEIYVFEQTGLYFLKANRGALENLGYTAGEIALMNPLDLMPEYTLETFNTKLQQLRNKYVKQVVIDTIHKRADGTTYPVNIHLQYSEAGGEPVFVSIVTDVTERRRMEGQMMQSKKLQSIGQLAAGIAHEINTPAQFVGDNIRFLKDSFSDMQTLIESYQSLDSAVRSDSISPELLVKVSKAVEMSDPEYLATETPSAIEQSLDGIGRISKIVQAMKEFSHPGREEKDPIDLNRNISNTIVVASNEWKYVATVTTEFDDNLPELMCYPQEISQVVLNLIVNASHAIADKHGANAAKGTIRISTAALIGGIEVRIKDDGQGISKEIQERVFDPFFTTKKVGKGTGQGLSMAYSTIVDKHGGTIEVESEVGVGTTFIIRLPALTSEVNQPETEEMA